jgi:hypothetical protein
MQYWDKTHNGQIRDRGSIETRHGMDKPVTQAALGKNTQWTGQRHRQYWDKTQNGQTRQRQYWDKTQNEHTRTTGIIGTKHIMDKSETE